MTSVAVVAAKRSLCGFAGRRILVPQLAGDTDSIHETRPIKSDALGRPVPSHRDGPLWVEMKAAFGIVKPHDHMALIRQTPFAPHVELPVEPRHSFDHDLTQEQADIERHAVPNVR